MIESLDQTIKKLILLKGQFDPGDVEVRFDQPTRDWAAGLTKPAINCYLYDIRENTVMRTREPLLERSADRTRASRRRPPVRVDCGYCITAWSQALSESVADEHRLLSQV